MQWRKAPGGKWVVEGPHHALRAAFDAREPVVVHKADGSTTLVELEWVGKPFFAPLSDVPLAYARPDGFGATQDHVTRLPKVQPKRG